MLYVIEKSPMSQATPSFDQPASLIRCVEEHNPRRPLWRHHAGNHNGRDEPGDMQHAHSPNQSKHQRPVGSTTTEQPTYHQRYPSQPESARRTR